MRAWYSLSQQFLGASFKCVSHIFHVWQEKLEHQQPFHLLPLRTVPENKGLLTSTLLCGTYDL